MKRQTIVNIGIAWVWLINGLICKILNMVPRHQEIVGRILGEEHAWLLTKAIGFSELLMVVWILSGIRSRWCAWFQIAVVMTMNVIECLLVPDLLLFGRWNILFAAVFSGVIYWNGGRNGGRWTADGRRVVL